jgi:hypothetical protein
LYRDAISTVRPRSGSSSRRWTSQKASHRETIRVGDHGPRMNGKKAMQVKLCRVASSLSGVRYGTLAFPPISLGILARHLRDLGHQVDLDDLNIRWYRQMSVADQERLRAFSADDQKMWRYLAGSDDADWSWFGDEIATLSDFAQADVILLSMISSDIPCCISTLAFAKYLKQRFGTPIVLGGEYFAYAPIHDEIQRVLQSGVLDYYVLGYGEEPLEMLLQIVAGDRPREDLDRVPGLRYLNHGALRQNSFVPHHALVPPDFEGLPVDLYRWSAECEPPLPGLPAPSGELTLPFHTSTGCPYVCSFCECSGMKKMSYLSAEKAVAELRRLIALHDCRTFFFLDNTLNFSPRWINEFCDRIIDAGLGIQWMDCASGRGIDRPILEKMRKAGVVRIVWGLESGSDRILRKTKKPLDLEQASATLTMSHEAGIWNGVEIIVGMPTETEQEFEETLAFIERHAHVLDEVWTYSYYLNNNSDMFTHHEHYGMTNVRRVNVGLQKDAVYGAVAATHIFDEVGGLTWAEKDEQQKRRLAIMLEHVARLGLYPMTWEHEQQPNLLAWCYRHAKTKAEIRKLYRAYWQKLSLQRTWSMPGRRTHSAALLAQDLYRELDPSAMRDGIRNVWQSIYADKYAPFFTDEQATPDLTYERRLLIDGRFHDSLVYSELKGLIAAGATGHAAAR